VLNPTSIAKPHAFDQLMVDVVSFNADVVVICESWLKQKHDSNLFSIPGYQLIRRDRSGRRGGGVCPYSRSTYQDGLLQFDLHHIPTDPLF